MVFSAAAVVSFSGTALADGGPHVEIGFDDDLDQCAGCHKTHTGGAEDLLAADDQWDLCMSCHDGAGALTNVLDGRLMESPPDSNGLRGGGFAYARMDPARILGPEDELISAPVTSIHTIGVEGTAFGSMFGSGVYSAGENVILQCTSCHNPHGNGRYRILRSTPEGILGDAVEVPDEPQPYAYTITYDSYRYRDFTEYPENILRVLDDWCSYCHVAYLAGPNAGHQDSGDPIFRYRHMTDDLGGGGCLFCHVAHGTSATMGPLSSGVPWPSSPDSHEGDLGRSALLWANSRAVCGICHTGQSLRAD